MEQSEVDWSRGEPPEYSDTDPVDAKARNIHKWDLDLDAQRQARPYITDFPVTPKDEQLVESIKANGLLEPLVVRPIECVEYEFKTDAKYVVVAGSRRFRAVESAGMEYVNCRVLELDDEASYRISLHENLGREDLTDYMLVKHIGGWFNHIAKDLVGEDEEVECPECGKECNGSMGLQKHIEYKHGTSAKLSEVYLSRRQIEEKIATELYGDENKWRTVRNIISVAKLPRESLCLIKTEGELTKDDWDLLDNYEIGSEDTPNASPGGGVATILVQLASLANTHPGVPGDRIVKAYAKHKNDIPEVTKRVKRWKVYEGDDYSLESFDAAVKELEPPTDEGGEDDDKETESGTEENESDSTTSSTSEQQSSSDSKPDDRIVRGKPIQVVVETIDSVEDLEEFDHNELRTIASYLGVVSGNASSDRMIEVLTEQLEIPSGSNAVEEAENEADESEEETEEGDDDDDTVEDGDGGVEEGEDECETEDIDEEESGEDETGNDGEDGSEADESAVEPFKITFTFTGDDAEALRSLSDEDRETIINELKSGTEKRLENYNE